MVNYDRAFDFCANVIWSIKHGHCCTRYAYPMLHAIPLVEYNTDLQSIHNTMVCHKQSGLGDNDTVVSRTGNSETAARLWKLHRPENQNNSYHENYTEKFQSTDPTKRRQSRQRCSKRADWKIGRIWQIRANSSADEMPILFAFCWIDSGTVTVLSKYVLLKFAAWQTIITGNWYCGFGCSLTSMATFLIVVLYSLNTAAVNQMAQL